MKHFARAAALAVVTIFLSIPALAAPTAVPPSTAASPSAAPNTPDLSKPAEDSAVRSERDRIQKALEGVDRELARNSQPAEELQSLRSDYEELLSIFDIHLIALADAKRLAETVQDFDTHFEQVAKDLRKDTDPQSFAYLSRLESALLDSRDELAALQKAAAQRRADDETQTRLANDLAKQLRLARDKEPETESPSPAIRAIEIREQAARATASLRRTEVSNFTLRETVEKNFGDRLEREIAQLQVRVKVSDEALKKLTDPIDDEAEKTADEVRSRQRELNQELTKSPTRRTEAEKRLGRLYSDLLNVYLSLLQNKLDVLDFKKQLLKKRFELRAGTLTPEAIAAFHRELSRRSSAADLDIVAQNQTLADIIGEYASRQEQFSAVENAREINDTIRAALRAAMMTLSELGKFNKMIKYLCDDGDFSKAQGSRAAALFAGLQSTASTIWNFEVFVVDESPITLGKLTLALLLFLLGVRVSRFFAFRFQNQLRRRLHLDSGAAVAFETISFYGLVILWAVISLQFARIPLTIFTLAGGALAIGVGFGSQTIVKNFFSGLILLLERPIRVGDLVQYDSTLGTVSRIGTRSTVIVTPDQLEVIVPNSYLIENTVTNLTLSNDRMRRKITVGVAYGSPLREVGQAILSQIERHNLVLKDPAPDVLFTSFGESALEFTVRFWVNLGKGTDAAKVESDLRYLIDGAFREAGIEIPYAKRDVQLTASDPLKIQVVNEPTPAQGKETPLP